MEYLEVTVQTASAGIELVASCLTSGGFDSLVVEDEAEFEEFLQENRAYWDYIDEQLQRQLTGLSRIRLYLEVNGTERAELERLKKLLASLRERSGSIELGTLEVTSRLLPETNWEESWRDSYPPQPVGEKLIVLPCWNPEAHEGRLPVILDPGLTFGTGAHPSTQMCMEFMEEMVQPGMKVIDLGSGSGILSITALRLGADRAVGVDIDPKAETVARENAAYNDFGADRFSAYTGNVAADRALMDRLAEGGYDLVLVNIVADVIISLAPVLRNFMKPGASVICSGILDSREAEVREALERHGLTVTGRRAREDWRCLRAKRRDEP